ncbi:acyl carrier protein (plasmid) [Haloferax sp. S1W]|uniref:acyl carrier protein n=1 Tax=Haloferax sp. S1W TaxID=3377110 RepID=UPI0037C7FB38
MASHVEEIIADRLRVDQSEFDASTEFEGETLDAESLDLVEVAEAVEADLGVHVPDDDLATLDTVGEFTDYVLANRD